MDATRENARRAAWSPPARPEWVRRVNDEGRCMDMRSVVPLDEQSLLAAAVRNTRLDDFGDDDWREPFRILLKSLDEEAELTLMGRLMTRAELLIYLEGRLCIEDTYRRNPEIDEQQIVRPLMILGQGRSGTSALLNLLAEDPENRVARMWEVMFPCPPPEAATYTSDPRIERADRIVTMWNRVTPEVPSVHEFSGMIPTENIQLFSLAFRSTGWLNILGQIPGYNAWMNANSMLPALRYDKRMLKLLQWKNPRKRWVLKNPDCARYLPDVLQVYPDMEFVWCHRDPVRALASMVNLIGILGWIRSDKPQMRGAFEAVTDPELMAAQLCLPIEWLESGLLPRAQLCNVQYRDFIRDPVGVAESVYAYFGREMSREGRESMRRYMAAHPRSERPAARIDVGSRDLVSRERLAFRRYQEYFAVPDEI